MSQNIKQLQEAVDKFKHLVEKRISHNISSTSQMKEKITEVQEELQDKANSIHEKIEGLKENKGSIKIVVMRVLPELPENFPKNFEFMLHYQDIVLTGNQKFLDFDDEGDLDEKFVVPLLEAQKHKIKVEIWATEQIRSLYDFTEISLEDDVELALENRKVDNRRSKLNRHPQLQLCYSLTLQGIGFESWLKNLQLVRQTQEELQFAKKQKQASIQVKKQKAQSRMKQLNQKFEQRQRSRQHSKMQSYEQSCKEIDSLLEYLKNS